MKTDTGRHKLIWLVYFQCVDKRVLLREHQKVMYKIDRRCQRAVPGAPR